MAKQRHPFHDKIVEMVCAMVPYKIIAFDCQATYRTVTEIADKYTQLIRVPKFDPGEGQRNFFDIWKDSKHVEDE